MSLKLRDRNKSRLKNGVLAALSVFAFVLQPFYGVIASQVANAAGGTFTYSVSSLYDADCSDFKCNSLQSAIDAAVDGNTIGIIGNLSLHEQVTVDKAVTIDGKGGTNNYQAVLWGEFDKTGNDNNSLIGLQAAATIKNITLDGKGNQLHGINAWHTNGTAFLQDVTVKNVAQSGVVAGEQAYVKPTNLTVENAGWHAINVDKQGSRLWLAGINHFTLAPGIPVIYTDDKALPTEIKIDSANLYATRDNYKQAGDRAYFLKNPAVTNLTAKFSKDSSNLTENQWLNVQTKAGNTSWPVLNFDAPAGVNVNRYKTIETRPDGTSEVISNKYHNTWLNRGNPPVGVNDSRAEFGMHGDGTYTYTVYYTDLNNGTKSGEATYSLRYDGTAPTVTIDSPVSYVNTSQPFTISGTYKDQGVNSYDVESGAGRLHLYVSANGNTIAQPFIVNGVSGTSGSYSYTLTPADIAKLSNELHLTDGQQFTVKAWVYDKANNWTNITRTLTSDVTIPNATLSFAKASGGHYGAMPYAPGLYARNNVIVKGVATDGQNSVKKHWFEVKAPNGTQYYWYNFNANANDVDFKLSDAKDNSGNKLPLDQYNRVKPGVYTVRYVATDQAGNRSDVSGSLTKQIAFNYTGPTVVFTADTSTGTTNKDLKVGYDVSGNNLSTVYVAVYDSSNHKVDEQKVSGITAGSATGVKTFDISEFSDGTYRFEIRASNYDGTWNSITNKFVTVDKTAPILKKVDLNDIKTVGGINYTNATHNGGFLDVTFTTDEPLKLVGSEVSFRIPGFSGPPATGWTYLTPVSGQANTYLAHIDLTNQPRTTDAFFKNKTYKDIQLYFRLVDSLGNENSTYYAQNADKSVVQSDVNTPYDSRNFKFTLDNTAPTNVTVTSPADGSYVHSTNGKLIVTGTVTDDIAMNRVGVQLIKPGVSGQIAQPLDHMYNQNPGTWSAEFDTDALNLADGQYGLNIYAVDLLGNVTKVSTFFTLDNSRPMISVTPTPTDGTLKGVKQFTVTLNGDHMDTSLLHAVPMKIWKSDVWAPNDSSVYFSKNLDLSNGSATFDLDTTKLKDGEYKLQIDQYIQDLAGNWAGGGNQNTNPNNLKLAINYWGYKVDNNVDTPVINSPSVDQFFNHSGILNSWSAVTDLSGIVRYEIAYNYDDGHDFARSTAGWNDINLSDLPNSTTLNGHARFTSNNISGTSRTHNPGNNEQGGVTIWVRAIDNAGNVSAWSAPRHYTFDKTAPTLTLTLPTGIQSLAQITAGAGVSYSAKDNYLASLKLEIFEDGNSTAIATVTQDPATSENIYQWIINTLSSPVVSGKYTVKLTATDKANNVSTTNSELDIDVDAPVITGDATGVVSNAGTIAPALTDEDGAQSGNTYVWVQTSGPSATISNDTALNPTFTPSVDGDYVFTLTATDHPAGNITTKTFSFTYTKPVVDDNNNGNQNNGGSGDSDGDNNGFSNVAVDDGDVQGATDDAGSVSDDDGGSTAKESTVAGAATHKTDGCFKFLGVCWYYWIPVIIVVIALEEFTRRKLKAHRANA